MGIKPSIHTSVWNQTYPKLSSARKYETMPLSSRKKPLASLATLVIFFAIVFTNFVHGQQSTPTNLINDFDDYSLCTNRYAKFSPDHTACVKPNKRCKINERGVNAKDKQLILDVHNYYRDLIASGKEKNKGFPGASNMLTLEWDDELAYVAQKHADQCSFEHDCYDCRRTEHYDIVGQNLYIFKTTRSHLNPAWRYVIKEWYDEIKIAPPIVAKAFELFNLNIGHFTQLAWATTNRIGCGMATYDNFEEDGSTSVFKTAQLYTCNYAPGGNYLGEQMYVNGTAASQCPPKYFRSDKYKSLCEFQSAKPTPKPREKKKKPVIVSTAAPVARPSTQATRPSTSASRPSTQASRPSTQVNRATKPPRVTPSPVTRATSARVKPTTARVNSNPTTPKATSSRVTRVVTPSPNKPGRITTSRPNSATISTLKPVFSNWNNWVNKWKATSTPRPVSTTSRATTAYAGSQATNERQPRTIQVSTTAKPSPILLSTTTTTTKYPWLLSFKNFTFEPNKVRTIPKRYLRIEMSHNGTVHQNIRTLI